MIVQVTNSNRIRHTSVLSSTSSLKLNHPDHILEVAGRVRLYSESQVHTVSRWEDNEVQEDETGGGADGTPFRGRSQSAPAALWKAKKYGRQLRRMSDEFDIWLDKGVSLGTRPSLSTLALIIFKEFLGEMKGCLK